MWCQHQRNAFDPIPNHLCFCPRPIEFLIDKQLKDEFHSKMSALKERKKKLDVMISSFNSVSLTLIRSTCATESERTERQRISPVRLLVLTCKHVDRRIFDEIREGDQYFICPPMIL